MQRSMPPLIRCGDCQQHIWPPDDGDGVAEPNLTFIRPELRDLAHTALEERNAGRFLILAESHLRASLAADNLPLLERLELWDEVVLHQILFTSTEGPLQTPPADADDAVP
jgi:hypothetical protein